MSECKCDLRTKMVGDGCEVCNPAKALEYAKMTIDDLEQDNARLVGHLRWCVKMLSPFKETAQLSAIRKELDDA